MKATASERITCAGYVRVSSTKQAKDGESLPDQRNLIEEYAQRNGHKLHKIYADEGVSGAKTNRPALTQLKKDAEQGLFQKVVFTALDRFGRNIRDALNNFEFFESRKIELVSLKEHIDTSTPEGELQRNLLSAIADWERKRITERIRVGFKGRATKGFPMGSPPYAYKWNEEKKCFETIPEEAAIYREMVNLFLVKNLSVRSVARTLNEKGYKAREGGKFTQPSIARVLRNTTYKGVYRFTFDGDDYELTAPRLIDTAKWNLIQERIDPQHSRHISKNYNTSAFILRGLLRCGECGYGIVTAYGGRKRKDGTRTRYYRCYIERSQKERASITNLPTTCTLHRLLAIEVERRVMAEILYLFQNPDAIIARWEEQIDGASKDSLEQKLKTIAARLGKLESQRHKLADLLLDDELDKALFKEKEVELKKQMGQLQDEKTALEKELTLWTSKQEDLENLRAAASTITEFRDKLVKAITAFTDEQKRGLIQAFLSGHRLEIRVVRWGDLAEDVKRMPKKVKVEPVIKDGKIAWELVPEAPFDINAAFAYLKGVIKLKQLTHWRRPLPRPPAEPKIAGNQMPPGSWRVAASKAWI